MFLLNSYLGLFTATALLQHFFLLTYGVILQSSFTTVVSLTLGHLSLSTCVRSWYGLCNVNDRRFSWELSTLPRLLSLGASPSQPGFVRGFACAPPALLRPQSIKGRSLPSPSLRLHCKGSEYQPDVHRLRLSASP